MLSHKTDSFSVSPNHFFYKRANVRLIVRKEYVRFQWTVKTGGRGVHKKNRNIQAADHLAVGAVKHLKTYDAGGLFWVKGGGELQALNLMVQNAVHGKAVAEAGQLLLKGVHNGGDKVRFTPKNSSNKSDLPCCGGIRSK